MRSLKLVFGAVDKSKDSIVAVPRLEIIPLVRVTNPLVRVKPPLVRVTAPLSGSRHPWSGLQPPCQGQGTLGQGYTPPCQGQGTLGQGYSHMHASLGQGLGRPRFGLDCIALCTLQPRAFVIPGMERYVHMYIYICVYIYIYFGHTNT